MLPIYYVDYDFWKSLPADAERRAFPLVVAEHTEDCAAITYGQLDGYEASYCHRQTLEYFSDRYILGKQKLDHTNFEKVYEECKDCI